MHKFKMGICGDTVAAPGNKPNMAIPAVAAAFTNRWVNLELTATRFAEMIDDGCSFTSVFKAGHRKKENFLESSFLALDFDKPNLELVDNHPLTKIASIRYSTPTSTPAQPKFRLVWVLDEPITSADTKEKATVALMAMYGPEAGFDPSCKDSARFFFGCEGGGAEFTGNILKLASVFDWLKLESVFDGIAEDAVEEVTTGARASVKPNAGAKKGKEKYLEKVLASVAEKISQAPEGQRHYTLIKMARLLGGYVAGGGLDEQAARSTLESAYSELFGGGSRFDMDAAIEAGLAFGKAKPIEIEPLPVTAGSQTNDYGHKILSFEERFQASREKSRAGNTGNTGNNDTKNDTKNDTGNDTSKAPPERAKKRLLSVTDLSNLPPAEFLVSNELVKNSLAFLVGEPGSKKSFIALDYARKVCEDGGKVVFVAGEGVGGIAKRIDAYRAHFGCEFEGLKFWPEAVELHKVEACADFFNEIEEFKPDFIVLDTLARCAVGLDENSAKDMGEFIFSCDFLRRQTLACVMVVHHTVKNGGSFRGSSAIGGAADTIIKVVTDNDATKILCEKQKDSEAFEDKFFKWQEVNESIVPIVTNAFETVDTVNLSKNSKEVLETLNSPIFEKTGSNWKRLCEALGWDAAGSKKATLFRLLGNLLKSGYVTQAEKGEPYYITGRGKIAISTATTPEEPATEKTSNTSNNTTTKTGNTGNIGNNVTKNDTSIRATLHDIWDACDDLDDGATESEAKIGNTQNVTKSRAV